jgi:hypothetical protein
MGRPTFPGLNYPGEKCNSGTNAPKVSCIKENNHSTVLYTVINKCSGIRNETVHLPFFPEHLLFFLKPSCS